jgi:outer membrane protein insertion porin family
LNASLGYIFGGGVHGVPVSERFFPGGIYTIRGFEPRSLGPTKSVVLQNDPNSVSREFNVGGNKQALFNLELEFPILEAAGIKAVLFADAGNAYDDSQNFFHYGNTLQEDEYATFIGGSKAPPPLGLYWSVGMGVRWFSPIGPLRFEWGFPLTKHHRSPEDSMFEFTIGNFF